MKLRSAEGFRFVAGEILITAIGILIALGANAAWQAHVDRRAELRSLREISLALQNDRADLTNDLRRYRAITRSAGALMTIADEHTPYEPSFDSLFADLHDFRIHVGNSAPFEALQSTGIDVIVPDSLRLALLHFYSVGNDMVRIINEYDNRWVEANFTPYLDRHAPVVGFSRKGGIEARVSDYGAMLRDPYFPRLLGHRRMNTMLAAKGYEATVAEATTLLTMISRRIAELE